MGYKRTAFVSEIDNMDVNEGGKCVWKLSHKVALEPQKQVAL